jgi:hypothetical protein
MEVVAARVLKFLLLRITSTNKTQPIGGETASNTGFSDINHEIIPGASIIRQRTQEGRI